VFSNPPSPTTSTGNPASVSASSCGNR
jgi:hypothetical protein